MPARRSVARGGHRSATEVNNTRYRWTTWRPASDSEERLCASQPSATGQTSGLLAPPLVRRATCPIGLRGSGGPRYSQQGLRSRPRNSHARASELQRHALGGALGEPGSSPPGPWARAVSPRLRSAVARLGFNVQGEAAGAMGVPSSREPRSRRGTSSRPTLCSSASIRDFWRGALWRCACPGGAGRRMRERALDNLRVCVLLLTSGQNEPSTTHARYVVGCRGRRGARSCHCVQRDRHTTVLAQQREPHRAPGRLLCVPSFQPRATPL